MIYAQFNHCTPLNLQCWFFNWWSTHHFFVNQSTLIGFVGKIFTGNQSAVPIKCRAWTSKCSLKPIHWTHHFWCYSTIEPLMSIPRTSPLPVATGTNHGLGPESIQMARWNTRNGCFNQHSWWLNHGLTIKKRGNCNHEHIYIYIIIYIVIYICIYIYILQNGGFHESTKMMSSPW